ncbi:hypothetical protein MTO96_031135 [Rhipicephalus appendiculatus]
MKVHLAGKLMQQRQVNGQTGRTGTSIPTSTGATSVAPQARHNGAEDEVSAADQPPTGHIDDSVRPAQQVPHVDVTAESTEEAQPLLRRSKRIRKPVLRF